MTNRSSPPHRTRYGTTNPELVANELWRLAASNHWTGYDLRQRLQHEASAEEFGRDFSHSSHRESLPGPFWSWERFGRTSTALPDGRVIHVGGEHEDFYDPDFCIYNDVVVDHAGGQREFYLYPKDVFPPTDFHTATLVGDHIILIGSVGYRDTRRVGTTQVLKLDTRTLAIEAVETSGDCPGMDFRPSRRKARRWHHPRCRRPEGGRRCLHRQRRNVRTRSRLDALDATRARRSRHLSRDD